MCVIVVFQFRNKNSNSALSLPILVSLAPCFYLLLLILYLSLILNYHFLFPFIPHSCSALYPLGCRTLLQSNAVKSLIGEFDRFASLWFAPYGLRSSVFAPFAPFSPPFSPLSRSFLPSFLPPSCRLLAPWSLPLVAHFADELDAD